MHFLFPPGPSHTLLSGQSVLLPQQLLGGWLGSTTQNDSDFYVKGTSLLLTH